MSFNSVRNAHIKKSVVTIAIAPRLVREAGVPLAALLVVAIAIAYQETKPAIFEQFSFSSTPFL